VGSFLFSPPERWRLAHGASWELLHALVETALARQRECSDTLRLDERLLDPLLCLCPPLFHRRLQLRYLVVQHLHLLHERLLGGGGGDPLERVNAELPAHQDDGGAAAVCVKGRCERA
jgi:hypothetical protein